MRQQLMTFFFVNLAIEVKDQLSDAGGHSTESLFHLLVHNKYSSRGSKLLATLLEFGLSSKTRLGLGASHDDNRFPRALHLTCDSVRASVCSDCR